MRYRGWSSGSSGTTAARVLQHGLPRLASENPDRVAVEPDRSRALHALGPQIEVCPSLDDPELVDGWSLLHDEHGAGARRPRCRAIHGGP